MKDRARNIKARKLMTYTIVNNFHFLLFPHDFNEFTKEP